MALLDILISYLKIWNLFLGGSSSTRPFGSAVLDGCVNGCVIVDVATNLTCYVKALISTSKEAGPSFSIRS